MEEEEQKNKEKSNNEEEGGALKRAESEIGEIYKLGPGESMQLLTQCVTFRKNINWPKKERFSPFRRTKLCVLVRLFLHSSLEGHSLQTVSKSIWIAANSTRQKEEEKVEEAEGGEKKFPFFLLLLPAVATHSSPSNPTMSLPPSQRKSLHGQQRSAREERIVQRFATF